jgi:hypothetical protein
MPVRGCPAPRPRRPGVTRASDSNRRSAGGGRARGRSAPDQRRWSRQRSDYVQPMRAPAIRWLASARAQNHASRVPVRISTTGSTRLGPGTEPARPAEGTPTSKASSEKSLPPQPKPTPSLVNATGGSSDAGAANGPWSRSPALSSSSSGTSSPTPTHALSNSDQTSTKSASTPTAKPETSSANSKHSATKSPSTQPPDDKTSAPLLAGHTLVPTHQSFSDREYEVALHPFMMYRFEM